MGRSIFQQETQIRRSLVADIIDSTTPTEAAFETNPVSLLDDMNNIRSQLHNLLKNQAGNWWDDLNAPTALENGTQRGVNDLNTSLHAIEKARRLRPVHLLVDVAVPASVLASGILTLTANAANAETVTIGAKTYTFQTVLTNVDGNVLIGATASDSIDNLIAAINLGAGSGSLYAAATSANVDVTAAAGAGDTMDVDSLLGGTQYNSVVTTEGLANGAWGGATLSGGAGDVVVLGGAEIPTTTLAAVGAVTTLGTVVAPGNAIFLTADLVEVSGPNALSPKNLVTIVDGTSGDPILAVNGKRVWGLLQSETDANEHTITGATTTRVQISFVRADGTHDDLELADGEDIGGKTINYCFRERVRQQDLNETDFLNAAVIDIAVGAGQTTRKQAYDNQGTTAVALNNNADLDISTGLEWAIRDNLGADLFNITEGSGGGTSTVQVSAATDTFDVDAASNDFLNGASFDTGAAGTTINIGNTANQIDSGGALTILSTSADLRLVGGAELVLDDSYRSGSTWSLDGIRLADTSAEWDAFEAAFGEVSLLNAITQAFSAISRTRIWSVATANVAVDIDVSGPSGDNNFDTDFGALDGGTFITDYDYYLNGQYLRAGATAGDNHDLYPGTSLAGAGAQLKFEFKIKTGDQLAIVKYV